MFSPILIKNKRKNINVKPAGFKGREQRVRSEIVVYPSTARKMGTKFPDV